MYKIKNVNGGVVAIENGISFAGYASVFNVIDRHGEVVEPGSFARTLKNFAPCYLDLLIDHDMVQKVGRVTLLREDGHGLFVEGVIDYDLPGSEFLLSAIGEKKILHFSIGYYPRTVQKRGGIRYISDLDLVEISFVEVAANESAKLLSVDGLYLDPDISSLVAEASEVVKSAEGSA